MSFLRNNLIAFVSGACFSFGLGISGMIRPSKVLGFLDLAGAWDPSLAFVMAGAILVYAPLFHLFKKRPKPLLATEFSLPGKKAVDRGLIFGALIFGFGWGLAGFCPGPALTSLVTLSNASITFFVSMLAGMAFYKFAFPLLTRRRH